MHSEKVTAFIKQIELKLERVTERTVQALVPFTQLDHEPDEAYACFELWSNQDYALGYNKFFIRDRGAGKEIVAAWDETASAKGSFLPEVLAVFENYYTDPFPGAEFTQNEGLELTRQLEALLFRWFAACWKQAGGESSKVPTFFCFEKEYKLRDLKTGEILSDKEVADRLGYEMAAPPATGVSPAPPQQSAEPQAPGQDKPGANQIDLLVSQAWLAISSDTALEAFKSTLANALNSFPEDEHVATGRWDITGISEGDTAHLVYDERSIATLRIENGALRIISQPGGLPRYDDVLYAIRYAAWQLGLAVYSNLHGGARLPQNYRLAIDPSYFYRDKDIANFFAASRFIPRFAPEGMERLDDDRQALVIYSPYYAEHKADGSIHILNNAMLKFLLIKDNQHTNREFSYKVADSMQDFAKKYDLGLIPSSFYQSYGRSTKIINETAFDIDRINRKVFIDPYVWDFDTDHSYRFYANTQNGMHFMDKVRKGENLDGALKRVLREELGLAGDYVGARVVGLDFDRDREGILTPRLKINIFVHGMTAKHRSQTHDWVSIK